MRQIVVVICSALLDVALTACAARGPSPPDSPAPTAGEGIPTPERVDSIETILKDPQLWGPDFPKALAYIPAWAQIGEREVLIFHNRVMGSTQYRSSGDAIQARDRLAVALRQAGLRPKESFRTMLAPALAVAPTLAADTIRFYEDLAPHIALVPQQPLRLVAPDLTVATVRRRLGPPEKTALVSVEAPVERRAAVLTLHQYAQGAVVFIETDFAPRAGVVDRVILSVPSVMRTLFAEGQ
jgi:hypothetical protein